MLFLKTTQNVSFTFSPKDNAGNAVPVRGVPVWTVSDAAVLQLTTATDGMSCTAQALGDVGIAQVHVTGEANMGEGFIKITDFISIEVQDGTYVPSSILVGSIQQVAS
jgi:hypothetical protein